MTYLFSSYKLITSFYIFFIFFLSGKNGKSLWSSCNFCEYGTSTPKISFITLVIIILPKIFIKLRSFFNPFKFIYWKLLRHCPSIQIIYIPIWWFLIVIIIFHIFVISFCISMYCVKYSFSNSFFNH